MTQVYEISPVAAPRMTQRDKWKKRPCVLRFFEFRDAIRLANVAVKLGGSNVLFVLPMPKSWSKKKKAEMDGQPHQSKPDIDNLIKALLDSVFDEDQAVWQITAQKRWGTTGRIEIS